MTPLEFIRSKRAHAARLANQRGAAGERIALEDMKHRLPRPTGAPLKMLLAELRAANKPIEFASQSRVEPGFSGFFFALTEGEIAAAEILGSRHRVALYNKPAGALLLSSVQEIVQRAKSSNWQLSVQL